MGATGSGSPVSAIFAPTGLRAGMAVVLSATLLGWAVESEMRLWVGIVFVLSTNISMPNRDEERITR
jgi:hypothetical protein